MGGEEDKRPKIIGEWSVIERERDRGEKGGEREKKGGKGVEGMIVDRICKKNNKNQSEGWIIGEESHERS